MEITFKNKKEDFEAFYEYMVKETEQGKTVNKQAFRAHQSGAVINAILWGSVLWAISESWKLGVYVAIFAFIVVEAVFLLEANFKPRYFYGKRVYRRSEMNMTQKDYQVMALPRKLTTSADWLEISNTETLHRWRWRQVDQIGITSDFIFVHVGVCPVFYIPKRDFSSEQSFIEFGKTLLELKEKNKNQPIGAE
jgi:hypothetical protein